MKVYLISQNSCNHKKQSTELLQITFITPDHSTFFKRNKLPYILKGFSIKRYNCHLPWSQIYRHDRVIVNNASLHFLKYNLKVLLSCGFLVNRIFQLINFLFYEQFSVPPIPPNPRTNWAPSCDLSVMISRVAPAKQNHIVNFKH